MPGVTVIAPSRRRGPLETNKKGGDKVTDMPGVSSRKPRTSGEKRVQRVVKVSAVRANQYNADFGATVRVEHRITLVGCLPDPVVSRPAVWGEKAETEQVGDRARLTLPLNPQPTLRQDVSERGIGAIRDEMGGSILGGQTEKVEGANECIQEMGVDEVRREVLEVSVTERQVGEMGFFPMNGTDMWMVWGKAHHNPGLARRLLRRSGTVHVRGNRRVP